MSRFANLFQLSKPVSNSSLVPETVIHPEPVIDPEPVVEKKVDQSKSFKDIKKSH